MWKSPLKMSRCFKKCYGKYTFVPKKWKKLRAADKLADHFACKITAMWLLNVFNKIKFRWFDVGAFTMKLIIFLYLTFLSVRKHFITYSNSNNDPFKHGTFHILYNSFYSWTYLKNNDLKKSDCKHHCWTFNDHRSISSSLLHLRETK